MRILIEAPPSFPPTIANGWCQALTASGFEVAIMRDYDHVFDVFADFKPDVFIKTSQGNRAIFKCVANRPRMKVIDQIKPLVGFDDVTYRPGKVSPALECDLAFVATWTPQNAPLYRSILDPLIERGHRTIKCFGAGEGCPYVEHLGWLDHALLGDLYVSAKLSLDLSDDLSERFCQIVGLGGRCVSRYRGLPQLSWDAAGLGDLICVPPSKMSRDVRPLPRVLTYFGRMAELFEYVGLGEASNQISNASEDYRCM